MTKNILTIEELLKKGKHIDITATMPKDPEFKNINKTSSFTLPVSFTGYCINQITDLSSDAFDLLELHAEWKNSTIADLLRTMQNILVPSYRIASNFLSTDHIFAYHIIRTKPEFYDFLLKNASASLENERCSPSLYYDRVYSDLKLNEPSLDMHIANQLELYSKSRIFYYQLVQFEGSIEMQGNARFTTKLERYDHSEIPTYILDDRPRRRGIRKPRHPPDIKRNRRIG